MYNIYYNLKKKYNSINDINKCHIIIVYNIISK